MCGDSRTVTREWCSSFFTNAVTVPDPYRFANHKFLVRKVSKKVEKKNTPLMMASISSHHYPRIDDGGDGDAQHSLHPIHRM
jgi:hypothetical protein